MRKLLLLFLFSFFVSTTNAQNFEWVKHVNGANGFSVITDSNGNVYTVGSFSSSGTDFDPGPAIFNMSSTMYYVGFFTYYSDDIFISKMDSVGNFLWVKKIGGTGPDRAVNVKLSNLGELVITCYFQNSADFDPNLGSHILVSNGLDDLAILKLDTGGNFIDVFQYGGYLNDTFWQTKLDSNGNIYCVGSTQSDSVYYNGTLLSGLSGTTSTDLAVLKLSPNGVPLWSRRFSGNGYSQGNDLDLDNDNNVYVVGYYNDSVDFDPSIGVYNQISIDDEDAFILKLDSLGNFLWVKSYSAIGREALSGVKTDALGNVFVSGKFQTTLSINSLGTLISNGTDDILILKLDSSGNEIMYRQIGGTQWDVSDKIVMDDAGFLYLNGYFNDTVDFDPSPAILNKSSNGATDSYFMKFNSQLNLIWAQTIGGPCNYDYIRSIHIDDYNKLYITGAFDYGSIDFDWGTGTTAISSNAPACNSFNSFVLKANQGVCDYVSINIDSLRAVSCNLQGYIDVSANTTGLPVNYSWFPAISTDTIASFSSAGIYTVNIVDANSCIKSLSLLLGEPVDYSGYDLSSNWVNTNFRSGNISMIFVDGFNDGCLPVSGNLKVVLDTLVNYVNAQPIPDNIIGDTLIWNFTNLTYDSVHVTPEIIVYTPTWASIGDTVCFKTIISPQVGDIDTTNNIKQYCIPVLNGYDPNDKKVYPIGICTPRYINEDELLTYTVRFQNTGNASAIDVYILDTLDTDLNLNTVRVIGNSHAVITEVLPGNVLKFRFDNINLADSASNEAASHGYVIFEVLPNTGLSNGTTITNKVGIYFDFNPPIFTNTVLNTISDGTVNTNVSAIGNTISASLAGVSYQWLNCDNSNSVIAGATNQSYTAMTSGNYSVIINDGCFVDTSACVSIFVTGISEVENNNQFSFYPNPSTNTITITTIEPTQLKIINMLGEVVLEKQVQNNSIIDINNLSNGIYFIQTKEGYSTKLIKN